MPIVNEDSDALIAYRTGSTADGVSQPDPDASIGGFRSGTAIRGLSALISNPIPPVVVENVSGANLEGVGTIVGADVSNAPGVEAALIMTQEDKVAVFHSDTVAWKSPLGAEGSAVVVHDGDSVVIEDGVAGSSKAVRVTRDGFGSLLGNMQLELLPDHRNVMGMGRVTNAQRVAGEDYYRGIIFKNESSQTVSNVAMWLLQPGGAVRLTDTAQLPGAGVGTIGTSGTFAGYPLSGGAQIRDNLAALKETVYYSSRTDKALNVDNANYRGLLGTAAAAGAADDVVISVPLLAVGQESVGGDGSIQTIADEFTAPAAISFDSPFSFGSVPIGDVVATIAPGASHGWWVWRQIPAGALVASELEASVVVQWTEGGTAWRQVLHGRYRVEDTVNALFEIYTARETLASGNVPTPGFDVSPDATNATLPISFALAAVGVDVVYGATLRIRDAYGLTSINQYFREQVIDGVGDPLVALPTAPEQLSIVNSAGGELDITAVYQSQQDLTEADFFRIYHRGDGTDPVVGVDAPTDIAMTADTFFGHPSFRLDGELGPNPVGTEIHALVRTFRSSDSTESANTEITVVTVDTDTSVPTKRRLFLGNTVGEVMQAPVINITTTYDVPNNMRAIQTNGKTELWMGAVLVWRLIYDGADDTSNGLWTTFGFTQEQQSGAAVADPVDVVSATLMYITVDAGPAATERRMEIDSSATIIKFTAIRQDTDEVVTSNSPDPIAAFPWHTLFQVFDNHTLDWQTVCSLDTDGKLAIRGGWQQRQTVGELADTV